MSILWNVYEVIINVLQGFILTYFTAKCLGTKHNKSFLASGGPCFAIVLSVLISLETFMIPFEYLCIVLYFVLIFVYAILFLNGSLLEKLFFSVIPVSVVCLSSVLCIHISMALFKENYNQIIVIVCWERFFSMLMTQFIAFYILTIISKLKNTGEKTNQILYYEWAFIIVVLVLSLIIGWYILAFSENREGSMSLYSIIVLVLIIGVNIVLCYLTVDLGRKNQAISENKILKMTQEQTNQYIDNVNREYEMLKKFRHDCKNSYLVVYSLLEKGEYQAAINQLKSSIDLISHTDIFLNTNNMVVNAIVNAKMSSAKAFGIECTCFSVSDITGIDDIDICRMLSNMLDNAITACQNNHTDKNFISLNITYNDACYAFILKNTITSSVLSDNPLLLSTKPDRKAHGYGTKIIREIAEEYNGYLDTYEENGSFCCSVILQPNK